VAEEPAPVTAVETATAEPSAEDGAAVEEGPYGPESRLPLPDGEAPEGFLVKGNRDSMRYHAPASPWYDKTVAEVYFRTASAAEEAGFTEAGKAKDED
jgi:hypothetical protein